MVKTSFAVTSVTGLRSSSWLNKGNMEPSIIADLRIGV